MADNYNPLKNHALDACVRIQFFKDSSYCSSQVCDRLEISRDGSSWNTTKFLIDQSATLPFHKVDQYIWALIYAFDFGYKKAQKDIRNAIGLPQ